MQHHTPHPVFPAPCTVVVACVSACVRFTRRCLHMLDIQPARAGARAGHGMTLFRITFHSPCLHALWQL
eukprot:1158614-Pelagomonas_calceolata.AAC.2